MKRAIITGATGVVGTALIRALIENNIEVLILCRQDSVRNSNLPENHLITKVYCDLSKLETIQNETGKEWDIFYHFAWEGTTGTARNDMYLQNLNVKYALDAVKVAHRFGCKKFIGAGSQAEYGRVEGILKPSTPVFPETGYGIAKLCASQMTRELSHQIGMEHNWVRILSVYGPNDGAQSMIMSTINKLRKNEIPQFTKGEQMWDYLYSGDAGQAFKLVGEKGVDGKVYVLGSGKARPLVEYIEEIRNIVEPKGQIELGVIPYSEKQVMHLQADVKELMEDTGWSISTNFSKGIRNILDWSTG